MEQKDNSPMAFDEQHSTGVSEPSPSNKKNVLYTFDEHMWDKLPEIQQHSQQGSKLLQEFSGFCKGYNNALQKFQHEIQKCHDTFQRNLKGSNKKGLSGLVDSNYFGYHLGNKKDEKGDKKKGDKGGGEEEDHMTINPMSDSVNCLKMGAEALISFMEERVTHITGDLIEPLDMYINHHEQTSSQ